MEIIILALLANVSDPLKDLFIAVVRDIWDKYGPFAALLVLFVIFHTIYTHYLWKGRLADKDKEIDRVVKERDRLQESVIQKRLSSKKDAAL